MKILYVCVAFTFFISVAFCALGVDVSAAVSTSDFSCLAKQGYTFAIVRCFQSTGVVDPNCATTAANAHAAGLDVDLYLFPCFKCGNAFSQMDNVSSYAKSKGVKYETLWLDIEGTQYWGTQAANVQFFQQLISAGEHIGITMGVYTSASQWTPIMGSSTAGSIYPVWYAHYDGVKSFADFTAFGGWKTPYMKQYQGDATVCGVGIDENYLPGGNSTTVATVATHATSTDVATHTATTATHATTDVATHATTDVATHATATHATTDSTHATAATHATSDTSKTTTATTYTAGSNTAGSGAEFRLSPGSIYNAKLGGNKLQVFEDVQKPQPKEKMGVKVVEVDEEVVERDAHFKVMEEKSSNKFFS